MGLVLTPRIDEQALLETAIIERLGVHVEVKDVRHSKRLVLVSVHFPELPGDDLLAWKEWLHTELRALAAEQPDGPVVAPHYVD